MPRPIFDVEQYELRGAEPQAFNDAQQLEINKALGRTHGQIDWTAQLLGFNGPNYWGRAQPKADFSYNFTGLPETMNEKRQMQTGAFGVYHKDRDYEEWPAPFNRSEVKASADTFFHIWEDENNKTIISPYGQGEDITYMNDLTLIVGGNYVFDAEIEVEIIYGGDQADEDPTLIITPYYGDFLGTNLLLRKSVNGSIVIKRKNAEEGAEGVALQVVEWHDISDWTPNQVRRQYLGCWGNKGNQLSSDFLFDSLSLHGADEHFSLFQKPQLFDFTVEQLLAKIGLEPSHWTGLHPEKFIFRVDGCEDDIAPVHPVRGQGVGNPWFVNKYWDVTYVDSVLPMSECLPNCNLWVKAWQLFESDDYDNGYYPAFSSGPLFINYDNDIFDNNPLPDSDVDDFEYNNDGDPNFDPKDERAEGYYNRNPEPAEPTDTDEFPWNFPVDIIADVTFTELENAEGDGITYEVKDEGMYDRMPFNGISSFRFTWEALAPAAIFNPPCVTWMFDAHLDNGVIEDIPYYNVFPPLDPNGDEWSWSDGPWAAAVDGVYDQTDGIKSYISDDANDICAADIPWKGWDDGEFDNWDAVCECVEAPPDPLDTALCRNEGCPEEIEETCTADGGYWTFLGPPNYEEDCDCAVECCIIDNERWDPVTGGYLGPDIVDGGIFTALCAPPLPPTITFCDTVKLRWVQLEELNEVLTTFEPSVNNAFYPLRVWNNHPLICTDEVPTVKGFKEYRNFLTADNNRGTQPEAAYRHHIRMPIEYVRNGKEWTRATQICNNQDYFSAPTELNEVDLRGKNPTPRCYDLDYRKDPESSGKIVYHEDYLISEAYEDFTEANFGAYEGALIIHEEARQIPMSYGSVIEYDHWAFRKYNEDGTRVGSYYEMGQNLILTGHLTTDIENVAIKAVDYEHEYDLSPLITPNITFPEDDARKVSEKNFVVSYAYFVTDFSASEEALFEPLMPHCWRSPLIDGYTDTGGECTYDPLESNTAYLLHPIEPNYEQRTRAPRLPGETSAIQGTLLP